MRGVLGEEGELALMSSALSVALETVLISTLLLTHLAVPTQTTEALCLYAFRYGLRGEESTIFSHFSPTRSMLSDVMERARLMGRGR